MQRKIQLACPAPAGSTQGNRVTALRWARILRDLGFRASLAPELEGKPDLLVALHARRSAAAAAEFKRRFPERPLVVALTGTDLYKDLAEGNRAAQHSLELADRLIVLHSQAKLDLPKEFRRKTRVIHQSVRLPKRLRSPAKNRFDVCVLSHLRAVKDPLRAALATRALPADSRLFVRHLGRALDPRLEARAKAESSKNQRYEWLGERAHPDAIRLLSASRLLIISSRMEGGANVIGEAASLGIAILATDVPGNRGLLGPRHCGYFEFGDTDALRQLLRRAESDSSFYRRLLTSSQRIAEQFTPDCEFKSWRALLDEIAS